MSYFSLDDSSAPDGPSNATGGNTTPGATPSENKTPDLRSVLSQVADWLQEEKTRRQRARHSLSRQPKDQHLQTPEIQPGEAKSYDNGNDNDHDLSLEKLEGILQGFAQDGSKLLRKISSAGLRKGSIGSKFKQARSVAASSDTEFFGEDILVPNVEARLDNTKTMAYADCTKEVDLTDKAQRRDYECWVKFKQDILRLTHTLKIKGWRRISSKQAEEIDVARLSGALTNAVYVVHPPKNIGDHGASTPSESSSNLAMPPLKVRPKPLLLRVYGPQALIDREVELNILRRLARKNIGPRLLGSFENGRFEEYLHAKTLTAEDLRVPETSKQIAKRMRELHDGIDLLESELAAGPATFVNWNGWVEQCEKKITWLDAQVHQAEQEAKAGVSRRNSVVNSRYTRRGLICGVEWPVFRKAYEAYRKRVIAETGGKDGVREQLIFSHNDTQYGNLMRLQPSGTSPLLQPSNHHKQLVVIDFEYAAQNVAGVEFANHFSEWCYYYHNDPDKSYICDTRRYPTEAEQYRFVRSYVMHRPQFNPAASATPKMEAREKTNITDFMLDARAPGGGSSSSSYIGGGGAAYDYEVEEKERERVQEEEIQRLLKQARLWRTANSAFWVAWGIVQAEIPELKAQEAAEKAQQEAKKRGTSLSEKVSAGEKKVVEKIKHAVESHGYKPGQRPLPMTDPLTEEEKELRRESRWDRPEGKAQEEAHDEAAEEVVLDRNESHNDTAPPSPRTKPIDSALTGEPNPEISAAETQAQRQHTSASETRVYTADTASEDDTPKEGEEEEFDYLAYSQDRAMFFWGDCIQLGIVRAEDLPEDMRDRVKIVPY
jgi:choline kinase